MQRTLSVEAMDLSILEQRLPVLSISFSSGPTYSAITLSPLHRVYVDLFRSVESAHRDQVSIVSDDT